MTTFYGREQRVYLRRDTRQYGRIGSCYDTETRTQLVFWEQPSGDVVTSELVSDLMSEQEMMAMRKLFTEIPIPPKQRMIIRVSTMPEGRPEKCEECETPRETTIRLIALSECPVCGRMLCGPCFGGWPVTAPDLRQHKVCTECVNLDADVVAAMLEMRAKLGGRA